MKFLIITHAEHKFKEGKYFSYEPYVKEMNIWNDFSNNITVIAPLSNKKIKKIEIPYKKKVNFCKIPSFTIISFIEILKSVFVIPIILLIIFKEMVKANHIHIRCPGNIGLLACFVQILFPKKNKTVKYAGNWDPNSKQPLSYKLQKWIVSNTFLTRSCKVIVYGNWQDQSKNIVPFFTASYKKEEIEQVLEKKLDSVIKFIFVGAFSKGKQPLLTVKTIHKLFLIGFNIQLNMYGEGPEFDMVKTYILQNNLQGCVSLHGNQTKDVVKKAYKESHFLIFISKSEGWPKVVAEAMFWRCLPISTDVSCVSYMLGFGNRGSIISPKSSVEDISKTVLNYLNDEKSYQEKVLKAQKWSQKFTLDKFESEIKNLFKND